jgi:hypothetical protein
MRPTTMPQSALRAPLNFALGTAARVRVLRCLAAAKHPIGIPGLARDAGLNERGVRTVLGQLERAGIVATVPGAGRQVALRDRWPFAVRIRELFAHEAARRDRVMAALRRAAQALKPPPIGVWMASPHAAGNDDITDPLIVVCHGKAADLAEQVRVLQRSLEAVSGRFDLPLPEVRSASEADLAIAGTGSGQADARFTPPLVLLAGVLPSVPGLGRQEQRARTHADRDAQALSRAAAIADLIRRAPALVDRAHTALKRRSRHASARQKATQAEWLALLKHEPPARLAALLVRDDERMRRLRQSMPFFEILTGQERREVEAFVAGHDSPTGIR